MQNFFISAAFFIVLLCCPTFVSAGENTHIVGAKIYDLAQKARLAYNEGKYDQVRRFYEQALKMEVSSETEIRSRDESLVKEGLLSLVAEAYQKQGKLTEAEKIFNRMIEIKRKNWGEKSLDVIWIKIDLAKFYLYSQNYKKSETLCKEIIRYFERYHPHLAIERAAVMQLLANIYKVQRKHAEVENAYRNIVSVIEKEFGVGHPALVASLRDLAAFMREMKRDGEAAEIETYKAANQELIDLVEKKMGPDGPATGAAEAVMYLRDWKRDTDAEEIKKRADSIRLIHF